MPSLAAPLVTAGAVETLPPSADPSPDDLLTALAASTAARTLADLAKALGCPGKALRAPLAALERLGLVERWPDAPDGPAVTLSPLGAERLGVALDESDRWAPVEALDARPRRPRPDPLEEDAEGFDPDRLPAESAIDPAAAVAQADAWACHVARVEASDRRPIHPDFPPKVRQVLGLALPWPVPIAPGEICPACLGKRLGLLAYCLVCDRSGLDRFLPLRVVRPADPPWYIQNFDGPEAKRFRAEIFASVRAASRQSAGGLRGGLDGR